MAEESKSRSKVERVTVHVRIRPFTEDELNSRAARETSVDTADVRKGTLIIKKDMDRKQFNFDSLFDDTSEQPGVYDRVARPVVSSMLQGYNATIFAYGQTGTGKTHTMIGGTNDSRGVIPRAVNQIFEHIAQDQKQAYVVQVGFLQIYMEMFQDLLYPDNPNPIRIREDPEEGLYLAGLTWVPVANEGECMELLYHGDRNRNTAFTNMNSHSSRSHAVYMVKLEKRAKYTREELEALEAKGEAADQSLVKSILYLVDLAGSERVSKSRAVGSRLDEAKNINLALLALGNCIQALADKKSKFVPFRDSKLTRLLEDSLGGNSKTSLIVTVGPSVLHTGETISSLLFGSRAMKIENRPEINKQVDYKALCAQLQAELDRINDGHGEVFLDKQQYDNEIEGLKRQVAELTAENTSLRATVDDLKVAGKSSSSQASFEALAAEKDRELEALKTQFKERLAAKEEEHSQFLEEIDKVILEQEEDLNSMRSQLAELQAEKKTLAQEKKYLQDELEGDRADRERRVMELSTQLDEAKKQAREFKDTIAAKDLELEQLKTEHAGVRKQAQGELGNIKSETLRLQGELDKARIKLETAQKDFLSQQNLLAKEQADRDTYYARELEGKSTIIAGLENASKKLIMDNEALGKKVKEREDAIRYLKKRSDEKEKSMAVLRDAKGASEAMVDRHSAELAVKDRIIEDLHIELRGKEALCEELKQQVTALEAKLVEADKLAAKKAGQLKELARELESTSLQVHSADKTVKAFEAKLQATEGLLAEVRVAADERERIAAEVEATLTRQLHDLQNQINAETSRLQAALSQQLDTVQKIDSEYKALQTESADVKADLSRELTTLRASAKAEQQKLLAEKQEEVAAVSSKYDSQILEMKSHYSRDLIQLRKTHEEETRRLQTAKQTELDNLKSRFALEHSEQLKAQDLAHERNLQDQLLKLQAAEQAQAKSRYESGLAEQRRQQILETEEQLKRFYESKKMKVRKMREEFEAEKAGIVAHYEGLMQEQERSYQEEIGQLQKQHKRDIDQLNLEKQTEMKHVEDVADEKVDRLRNELERLEKEKAIEIKGLHDRIRSSEQSWGSQELSYRDELAAQADTSRKAREDEVKSLRNQFGKQIDDLKQSHSKEVARLQRELETLERSSEAQLKAKDTELLMRSDDLKKLETDLSTVQSNLQRTQQTLRKLQSDLQAATLNYESEISKLKTHHEDMLAALAHKHSDEVASLEACLATQSAEASTDKARVEAQLRAELDRRRQEWEELLETKSRDFHTQMAKSGTEKEEIELSLKANIDKLKAQYAASLQDAKTRGDEALSAEVARRNREISELNSAKSELAGSLAKLEKDTAAVIARLNSEVVALKDDLETATAEHLKAQGRISQLVRHYTGTTD